MHDYWLESTTSLSAVCGLSRATTTLLVHACALRASRLAGEFVPCTIESLCSERFSSESTLRRPPLFYLACLEPNFLHSKQTDMPLKKFPSSKTFFWSLLHSGTLASSYSIFYVFSSFILWKKIRLLLTLLSFCRRLLRLFSCLQAFSKSLGVQFMSFVCVCMGQ